MPSKDNIEKYKFNTHISLKCIQTHTHTHTHTQFTNTHSNTHTLTHTHTPTHAPSPYCAHPLNLPPPSFAPIVPPQAAHPAHALFPLCLERQQQLQQRPPLLRALLLLALLGPPEVVDVCVCVCVCLCVLVFVSCVCIHECEFM